MKEILVSLNDTLHDLFPGGEFGRKLVHGLGTAFPALLVVPFIEWIHVTVLMVLVTTAVVSLEVLRLQFGVTVFLHDLLLREYEHDSPAAYMLYMLSMTVVAVVFDPGVAIPAILMLAIGDPIAGVVSADELRLVKRPTALAAMFAVCALLAAPFAVDQPLAVALGAAGGTVADGVKPTIGEFVVDDDLTVAPLGALGLWLGANAGDLALGFALGSPVA
jgi:dolichol kinase